MPVDPTTYSYKVVKPFAYESTTSPIGQKAHTYSTRQIGKNALGGASAGSAFGPWGAAIGAAVGLGTDLWQAHYAKKRAKEANEESRKAAAEASARASAEARAARAYNSEGAQIRRLRMAGLSPGLAYGNMSPSTAVAAPQEKADVSKADTPKFDNESILHALQLLINQQNANTQLAAQQSTANLQDTQATINRIEAQYKAQEKLASISAILAQKDLTDEQKLSIIAKRMPEIQLLESQANLADANARNANANANVTEQTGVEFAKSQILSNKSSANLSDISAKKLRFEYDLDRSEWQTVQKLCRDYSEGDSIAPFVLRILDDLAKNSHTTIGDILKNIRSLMDIL